VALSVSPKSIAKELFDRAVALMALALLSPLFAIAAFLVWRQDGRSPLYISERAGRGGRPFRMVKVRSMVVGADKVGSNSTASDDSRITRVGRIIRRWKIDELGQLWNVLKGDMSLVGPRPQVLSEVETYTAEESRLLLVKPGLTDFASIVFADEDSILFGAADPYEAYVRLIRPWKSRLGLFYVEHASFQLDLQLILLTVVRIVSPVRALADVAKLLVRLGAPEELVRVSSRASPLVPGVVPGRGASFDR
jgi:lipopolysaccharide/colanic/teichoic acid biosynthesis glycosyltransferase